MSDVVKIDKGIPIPGRSGGGRLAKWPWATMEVGDSFFAEGVKPASMRSQITEARRRYKRQFTARTIDGGVRVWRTE